jgi:hypothetical protein
MSNAIPERADTVVSTILSWSQNRPHWQRDALRRIVLNGFPDEDTLREIKPDISMPLEKYGLKKRFVFSSATLLR